MTLRFLLKLIVILMVGCSPTRKYTDVAQRWEKDMQHFDSLNMVEQYSENSILFTGSSSIRLWDDINEDMAPYPVIRRGYGGAAYTDLAYYIERMVFPHDFTALVVFAGNDIWGKDTDTNLREISKLLKHIIKQTRRKYRNTPVFVIEVTHVPARKHLIAQIDAQNRSLRTVCDRFKHVHWIPTKHIYLTPENQVRMHLFREDNIHQNDKGYRLWTEAIKGRIKEVLREEF